MVKIKFKKSSARLARRALGTVKFFGAPRMISKHQHSKPLRFKTKHTSPSFASFTNIPRPTSVSIFAPSMNRPALKFYGDSDGDGVMNGFDCAPFNSKRQGPEHKKKTYEFTLNLSPEDKIQYEKTGILKNTEGRIVMRNLGPAFEKDDEEWKKHQRWRQEMGYLNEQEKKDNIF